MRGFDRATVIQSLEADDTIYYGSCCAVGMSLARPYMLTMKSVESVSAYDGRGALTFSDPVISEDVVLIIFREDIGKMVYKIEGAQAV